MPSDPPTPAQWNLHGWMAAYHEAQRRGTPLPTSPSPVIAEKVEPLDKMQGGWQAEGKERPETPKICTRCQWVRRAGITEEPDKSSWCEACIEGKPGPGTVPPGPKKPFASPREDVTNYNNSFFGG